MNPGSDVCVVWYAGRVLVVCDYWNHRLRSIDLQTHAVTTITGAGTEDISTPARHNSLTHAILRTTTQNYPFLA